MHIGHYGFVLFIFALLLILVWVHHRLGRSQSGQGADAGEREQKLFRLYRNLEESMEDIEAYVEDAKEDMAARMGEAQALCSRAEMLLEGVQGQVVPSPPLPGGEAGPSPGGPIHPPAAPTAPLCAPGAETSAPGQLHGRPAGPPPSFPRKPAAPGQPQSHPIAPPPPSGQSGPLSDRRMPAPGSDRVSRPSRVLELAARGMDAQRIAQELGIARGEVQFIRNVHKKAASPGNH